MPRFIPRSICRVVAACLGITSLFISSSGLFGAVEPDVFRVRVSVKVVLSGSGARPQGSYNSPTEITRVITKCNEVIAKSGANWTFVLTEIKDVQAASAYYSMSASRAANLEADAKASPAAFGWRIDAVNIYVVDTMNDAGGVCSFPLFGPSREIIVINSRGILGGSEGWLHEMGHYFNLIHPHEGDDVVDTMFDPPLPSPFNCNVHDKNFRERALADGASEEDTFNGLHNVMGYHCDPLLLTPLQVIRAQRALLDYRANVLELSPVAPLPTAHIALPPEAAGGLVNFEDGGARLVLDGSGSEGEDGEKALVWRWQILDNPGAGARFVTPARGWARARSSFGYGDDDDITVLSDMEDRYLTIFATREFEVEDPAKLTSLALDVTFDDSFAAYLNGTEVARRNLASGAGVSTPSDQSIDAMREVIDISSHLDLLQPGQNRLSLEAHNSSLGSSDLSLHPVLSAHIAGAKTLLIPSRAVWYLRKGTEGAPPAAWTEREFDAGQRSVELEFTKPGKYRVRLTVEDDEGGTDNEVVDLTVGANLFVRGDCNRDGAVDVSDALRNLLQLFAGQPTSCPDACDLDDDDASSVTDTIYLLEYLFQGGPEPPPPFPTLDTDPSGTELGCA